MTESTTVQPLSNDADIRAGQDEAELRMAQITDKLRGIPTEGNNAQKMTDAMRKEKEIKPRMAGLLSGK